MASAYSQSQYMSEPSGSDRIDPLDVLFGLTYDEAHSALLGLIGLLAGFGAVGGYKDLAAYGSVVLIGIMFGFKSIIARFLKSWVSQHVSNSPRQKLVKKPLESTASKVIATEPWYFTTVYVLSFLSGATISLAIFS